MRLEGKTAIVTGASRGIGRAIAIAYAAHGARVAMCARKREPLLAARDEIIARGGTATAIEADVSVPEDAERLVRHAIECWGAVDVLVNNAGVAPARVPVCDTAVEDWVRMLAVNLTGAFLCTRAAVPHMRGRGGAIINVSSRLGRGLLLDGWGAYSVSKWGLEGLTLYLANELRADGIRVNSVAPGLIATELTGYEGTPPESVVDVFVFLASDEAQPISGRAVLASAWREELGV